MYGITQAQTNKAVRYMTAMLGQASDSYEIIVEFAADKVLNYCNRNDLPDPLVSTVASIASDMFKDGFGNTEDTQEVSSMSEGDTSISFQTSKKNSASGQNPGADIYLAPYISSLKRYRKMVVVNV